LQFNSSAKSNSFTSWLVQQQNKMPAEHTTFFSSSSFSGCSLLCLAKTWGGSIWNCIKIVHEEEVLITTQKMKLFMHSLGLSQKLLTPFKWLLTNNFKALGRKSVVYLEGTLYLSNFPPRKWEGYYMLTPQ